MASPTVDFLVDGDLVMHDHSESDLGAILDPRYLKLDQSAPQTTVGTFTFPSVIATNYLKTPKIYPSADSATAIQILKAGGTTSILNVDTTNSRVGIGTTSPTNSLSFGGNSARTVWMERHTTSNTAGNSFTIQAGGATSGATDKNGGSLLLKPGVSTGTGSGQIVFYVYPAQLTGSVKTISATPTAGGSGYTAGDVLTITTGGGDATVTVETVGGSGAVLTFVTTPVAAGTGYTVSTGNATSYGGAGIGATVSITAITGTSDCTLTQLCAMSGTGVYNSFTYTSTVVQSWATLTNTCLVSPTVNSASTYYGAINDVRLTTNVNLTNATQGLTGLNCLARHQGSGTVTAMNGLRVYGEVSGGGTVTSLRGIIALSPSYTSGTVTSASGFYIQNQGNAKVTNSYGLYLDSQSGSGTGNFAIVTNAGNIVFNEGGDASTDFRVEGDTTTNLLFADASADAVGINYSDLTGTTGKLLVNGNVGIGTTSPTNLLSLGGNSARIFWMERHTTANTAGNTLTITAGGATSGATDKNGGNLLLQGGLSTGTGESGVVLYGCVAGASGTTDRTQTPAFQTLGNKIGFFNVTPVVRATALTTADASALNTGDATSDTVIANMRTRINELESKLQSYGLLS